MPSETVELSTYDSERLEARWDLPPASSRTAVFCHPHPQQGGTMTAPLMERVTARLVANGFAVLRFNFRGVGGSSGTWDGGVGEIHDVEAAVDVALARDPATALCGWSFGAATALRWQAVAQSQLSWVGIAPPVPPSSPMAMPGKGDLSEASRAIIIGDRDQLIDVADARTYAGEIGAGFHLVTGSDHFFHFREDRVAELMLESLRAQPA